LYGGLVGDESVVWPERLNLEKLEQIVGVFALLDFAEEQRLGALPVAVGFHGLEIIGEKFRVAVLVFIFECSAAAGRCANALQGRANAIHKLSTQFRISSLLKRCAASTTL
jgi:hypothetical protein